MKPNGKVELHTHKDFYYKEGLMPKEKDGVHFITASVKVYCSDCGALIREVELKY